MIEPLSPSAGFIEERSVILPNDVVTVARKQRLTRELVPTHVGIYREAWGHRCGRAEGAEETIFMYCTQGSGWCDMSGERFEAHAGDLLVVPAFMSHSYGADVAHPWTIHWFHALGQNTVEFLRELDEKPNRRVFHLGRDAQLINLHTEILTTLEQGTAPLQLFHSSNALAYLLSTMVRLNRENPQDAGSPVIRVEKSIFFMKQHLADPLDLATLSSIANLSPSHYSMLFKRCTGTSPIDHFTRLRIEWACELLTATDLSIKQVAASIGYPDALHFSRVFRSIRNVSPRQYRELKQG